MESLERMPGLAVPTQESIPQEILQKGLRASLEHMQSHMIRHRPEEKVGALKAGDGEALGDSFDRADSEINALAGYFAEPCWKEMRMWFREHPQELYMATHSREEDGEVVDVVPHRIIYETFERSPRIGYEKLYLAARETQKQLVKDFCEKMSNKQVADPNAFESRAYARYKKLLTESQSHMRASFGTPQQHLISGFNTVADVSHGVLYTLPIEYRAQFKGQPTSGEANMLIRSAEAFVLYLASLQLTTFAKVMEEMMPARFAKPRLVESHPGQNIPHVRGLKIEHRHERFRIDLQEEMIAKIVNEIRISNNNKAANHQLTHRTGCPALVAQGEEHASVIGDVYNWHADLARTFYYPYVTKATSVQ